MAAELPCGHKYDFKSADAKLRCKKLAPNCKIYRALRFPSTHLDGDLQRLFEYQPKEKITENKRIGVALSVLMNPPGFKANELPATFSGKKYFEWDYEIFIQTIEQYKTDLLTELDVELWLDHHDRPSHGICFVSLNHIDPKDQFWRRDEMNLRFVLSKAVRHATVHEHLG